MSLKMERMCQHVLSILSSTNVEGLIGTVEESFSSQGHRSNGKLQRETQGGGENMKHPPSPTLEDLIWKFLLPLK
ncbi:hypothetical protein TNCT_369031 [Trichonephila clavata]|uniref:Uncharacterized protein n=1 Tax=Trichonephila clavata TaxID=2740835 RepID=A0A8X6HCX4_TRICU|nr:hypothetical protein TNCT_369031 [Trichonephila clavata]